MNTQTLKRSINTAFLSTSLLLSVSAGASMEQEPQQPSNNAQQKTAKSVASQNTNAGQTDVTSLPTQAAKLHIADNTKSHTASFKSEHAKGSKPTSATKAHHDVWIHSVDIDLKQDPNYNGYYNRIIVEFDADTDYASYDIYAELALTDSYGNTTVYFETDDFLIFGESSTDDYKVDTVLTNNWPADGYELSIALYDAYSHHLVGYIDASDSHALADLHLESVDFEYQAPHHLSVFSAQSWLVTDMDNDGYYHGFSLDIDIDNNYGTSDVYANVYMSRDRANWSLFHVSENFSVNEDDTSDRVHWEFDLQTGYSPDLYYIRVEVIDLHSQMTLLTMEPESHSALYALPLEDYSYEAQTQPTPPAPVEPPRTSVSRESGGSFGLTSIMMFSLLAFLRRRRLNH